MDESQGRICTLFCALQFLPRSLVAEGDTRDGSWYNRPRLESARIDHELERIIAASSNEGDMVLDPFCGCGTAIHAAHKLNRQWIGIDITHLAISLVEKRLRDAFPGITFEVHGTPTDLEGAGNLAERDKYDFQYWACSLVNAQPFRGKKKGADTGIDGLIFFQEDKATTNKIIVSVKGGENVGVPMIRDLGHVIDREKAVIGLFVTLTQPTRPMREEAIKAGYYQSFAGASLS